MNSKRERARRPGAGYHGYVDTGLTPKERAFYGATVTATRVDAIQEPRTIVGAGTTMDALRACVLDIDAWEGDWRIVCVSTPVTIHRDLWGARRPVVSARTGKAPRSQGVSSLPEGVLLGKMKRRDLLPDSTRGR